MVRSNRSWYQATGLSLAVIMGGCSQEPRVWFCPEDQCANQLISEMDQATVSVHVAIYSLTHDEIISALAAAAGRGVEVQVVAEKEGNSPDMGGQLRMVGVDFVWDTNPDLMHNKFTVVDGQQVLTGSFNYSWNADQRNDENLVLLPQPELAAQYEAKFKELLASGELP